MQAWWNSLVLIEQVFAIVAIPATILLLIQTLLLLVGLGSGGHDAQMETDVSGLDNEADLHGLDIHDVHYDHDAHDTDGDDHDQEHEVDHGLRVFTLRGIVAFFAIFGWCGLACVNSGWSHGLSVGVSIASGILAMVSIAIVMKMVMKLQFNGTTDLKNAIGKTGTVYIRVPEQRREKGKISLLVQDQLVEADAVTDETIALKTGTEVVVIGLSGLNTLIVAAKKK